MKTPQTGTRTALKATIGAISALSLALIEANAATTDLASVPLKESTSVTVLPNIFFILDDSGSMAWDYMPDYVNDGGYCRSGQVPSGGWGGWTSSSSCAVGDPPYFASAFNGVYYNPSVVYTPPVDSSGNIKQGLGTWLASSKDWAHVPIDGYGIQSTSTINLTTGYPERKWCKSSTNLTSTTDCKSALNTSNNYVYPDSTYQYASTFRGAPFYYNVTVQWCNSTALTTCQARKTSTYQYEKYSSWQRVNIVSTNNSYPKAATRTDCAGTTTCTYDEEMANFANWYAWYHTRIQMMKTAMSLAFKDVRGTPNDTDPLDKNYFHARVGFTTIHDTGTSDGDSYLGINNFDSTQKSTFYSRMFGAPASGSTPLRGALTKAGRLFAGKIGTDPMQYSCQRNYTILSTDGYWNTGDEECRKTTGGSVSCTSAGGSNIPTYSAAKIDGTSWIGDMDGAATCNAALVTPKCNDSGTCDATPTRPACDTLQKGNTLADIAYYYYHTDLRPTNADGTTCTRGSSGTCKNNVPTSGTDPKVDDMATWQHMTTFTVGMGLDGTLAYQDGYKTATSGDYYNIKSGATGAKWPDPIANTADERVDDLWHAAVDGRGTYFSAKNPESLVDGLTKALNSMSAAAGAGASAATSNLQPTSGDNYIYVANYRTVNWDGNVSAYTIDLASGTLSANATWQASSLLNGLVTGSCGDQESRKIYTGRNSSDLREFKWGQLTSAEQAYFANSKLYQYKNGDWAQAAKDYATGEMMVNFLRGHNRYEDQARDTAFATACPTYHRLYRDRENVLGDIVHSQPVYVDQPYYAYGDSGYTAFKSTSRDPRVYVAANDGMLHAFDAATGVEKWAYIPPIVMKDLYHLAETDYSTNHRYFMDGPTAVSDIHDGTWKTILVGAMGKGGRGYYALDITGTDSTYPKILWTFTADDNPNVGFTYGTPMITKLGDGTWVVVVTSGHNNVPNLPNTGDYPSADGRGRVFVLRASDGAVLKTIDTGEGTASNPSGLANLNVKVVDFQSNNTAIQAYGGDLLGNMYRFDLDAGTSSKVIALGSNQPITAAPEIGDVDGKTVLFFGTGRYLGKSDLKSIPTQAMYGVRDDGSTTVTKSQLTSQTMSGGDTRTISNNDIDWTSKYGWYVNLSGSELVHIPAQLYFGTLVFASVVPSATECEPGGHGFLYMLNYRTGSAYDNSATTVAGTYSASPIVGFSVSKLASGAKVYPVTADGAKPTPTDLKMGGTATALGSGRRVMWRELME
jgi:type IV pilus assembly protein PilY1